MTPGGLFIRFHYFHSDHHYRQPDILSIVFNFFYDTVRLFPLKYLYIQSKTDKKQKNFKLIVDEMREGLYIYLALIEREC